MYVSNRRWQNWLLLLQLQAHGLPLQVLCGVLKPSAYTSCKLLVLKLVCSPAY
jgi:hypothetical protein